MHDPGADRHADGIRDVRPAAERTLIVVVLTGLVLAALPGMLPEPFRSSYPALTLPSFAATPRDDGSLRITRPEVTVDLAGGSGAATRSAAVPYSALLPPGSPNAIQLFRAALGSAYDAADPSIRPWLLERLAVALPGSDPTAVTVTWVRTCYSAGGGICGRSVVDEFRIELDDA